MPHGRLTVIVENAIGIKDPSKHGRGGSYCTLQCGSQALSTHVAEGAGSHPIFRTEFKFEIDRSTNDLVVSVYSRGSVGDDDEFVGSTTLDFKTVFFHGHAVPLTAYPLVRRSGRAGGLINISLIFKARLSPYAHNPHAPMHQHSTPPHARNQHNYETYEDGYGSSGSDQSSRSSKRSGDRPLHTSRSRSQSQGEQYYEDDASPRAADYNYEHQAAASYDNHNVHQAQPRYHHGRPSPLNRPPAAAHQAIPHRAIPTAAVIGAIPHRAGPPQVVRQQQPPRRPQPAQRVQYQQQQQQPGVMAQAAGQVAHAVAVEVARQSVQAMAGGFGDLLGGVFGGE